MQLFKFNLTNLVCFISIKQKQLQFVMDLSVMSIQLHPMNLKFTSEHQEHHCSYFLF